MRYKGKTEMDFRKELENIINRHSQENGSNTPDFILAIFLSNCLIAFDTAVNHREEWYGRSKGWRWGAEPRDIDFEVATGKPPTATELEAILNSEDDGLHITINPDGSISYNSHNS